MIKIILGDDDSHLLALEQEKILEEIAYSKIDAQIVCVAVSGAEILTFMERQQGAFLCFLDLDFGDEQLNGIDLARKMKQLSPESKIVFVTNHEEMALKVLKSGVEPFGFLEKTTDMSALRLGYRKYLQIADYMLKTTNEQTNNETIVLTTGFDETITLLKRTITYVETNPSISHGITYHTADGSHITIRGSIMQAAENLGEDFIKCHRAILVNRECMIALEEDQIRLANGDLIPCSFRLRKEIRKMIYSTKK